MYIGNSSRSNDIFVAKINPTGSELLFSTYLGGLSNEMGFGLALDNADNIYVTGHTQSKDYPVVNPFQASFTSGYAVFLTKLGSPSLPASSSERVTTETAVLNGTLELSLPNIQSTGTTGAAAPTAVVEPLDTTAANLTVSNNLGAYDISVKGGSVDTTGYYGTGCMTTNVEGQSVAVPCWEKHGIKVAFTVPAVNDPAVFNNLVISHGEDTDNNSATPPVLVPYDQSYGSARHTYKDFATRTIWVYVPSLSPFVILKGASDQIADLAKLVYSFNLRQGINNSLDAKLQNAVKAHQAASAKDRATACNVMGAFLSEVQAQTGKSITTEQAQRLTLSAKQVRTVLGCR